MEAESCRYCDEDIDGVEDNTENPLIFTVGGDAHCETSPCDTGQHEPDRDHWNGKDEEPGPDLGTIKVDDLYYIAVEATAHHQDWNYSHLEGYGESEESWDFMEAINCQTCGRIVVAGTGGPECPTCGAECTGFTGPMMNCVWPLVTGDFDEETAAKLIDLPLCLVEVGGAVGLALTGGGMDLSWEIAKAYMVLGYLPPATLDLPGFAGREFTTPAYVNVIQACWKSQQAMIDRAARAQTRLMEQWPHAFESMEA